MSPFVRYVLLVLIVCTAGVRPSIAEPEAIRIGWIGPLSGNSAVLGVDSVEAARIAVDEANSRGGLSGRKLELVVEDDQYDTTKSMTAYQKLYASGVRQFLISTYGATFALDAQVVRDGSIVINPLDCNNDIAALSDNIFCVATESESVGRALADHIQNHARGKVGLIYDERNPFMTLVANVIKQRLSPESLVLSEAVDQNSITSFRPLITRARQLDLTALILLGHDPMGQAMREARSARIDAAFYTVGTITSPGFQELAGESANGARVAFWEASQTPALQAFLEKFQGRAGRPPILQLATVPSYDAARMLIDAISTSIKATGDVTSSGVRAALLNVRNYPGLSGMLTMDQDGAVRSIQERIYKFKAGKLELEDNATITEDAE